MTTIVETLVYGDFVAPAGTVVNHVTVTFTGTVAANTTSVTVGAGITTATSPTLNPDTYTVTAQAFTVTGTAVGPVATDPVAQIVPVPATVTVSIPVSISGGLV